MLLTVAKKRWSALLCLAPGRLWVGEEPEEVPVAGNVPEEVLVAGNVPEDAALLELVEDPVLDDRLVDDDTDPLWAPLDVELVEWPPPQAARTSAAANTPATAVSERAKVTTTRR
jgi:hypothetical protein